MTQLTTPTTRTRRPWRRIGLVLLLGAALTACAGAPPEQTAADARAIPEAATSSATPLFTARAPVRADRQMVSAANPLAAAAGRDILRAGGSAVDAAIAIQLVLNVVEPQSSGIGGGGFMLHYAAKTGSIVGYDGREAAPAAATGDMFLNPDGTSRKFHDVVPGGLSVGVPGLLRMLEFAHKDHGKLPWRDLFAPAIELAEKGFDISPRLYGLVSGDRHLKKFDGSRNFFFEDDGKAKAVGTRLINKPLAETFKLIADIGPDAFYVGPVAESIVAASRNSNINPGRITVKDLETYRARKVEPICSLYRKWVVCGMPPPTSGGITALQILGILQNFDLRSLNPTAPGTIHLIAEASRLAYADRATYIADSTFVDVPVTRMIDPGYLATRAKLIDPKKSMGSAKAGSFDQSTENRFSPAADEHGLSTTHFSVVDKDGNVVALTSSIENAFGSRLMARGFLLNNQLTDFSFLPIKDGKVIANRVEAGKRPRSSMSPTIVLDGAGKPVLAVGSPGGSSIIGYVAKTIVGVLDWDLDPQAAIELPHFVNRNSSTDLEKGSALEAAKPALEALGHRVRVRALTSGLHAIQVTGSGLVGGADPRREGIALGD